MFDTPIRVAFFRAVLTGLVLAVAAMVSVMIADPNAEFFGRGTVLTGASIFLTNLITRGGVEGFIDQGSATQRAADKAKGT